MEYKTYIDESGNTGSDLLNSSQKIFCLSSVSIPSSQMENLKIYIQEKFESVKEKEEKEIKATKWIKSSKKKRVLQEIVRKMKSVGCDFSAVIIEKRYMLASLIVDNFLDGAYNDNEDYTWCNNKEEKIRAAQYFYDTLNDENCDFILPAFTSPTIENIQEAIHIVIEKTQEARYRTMLEGCHIQELFEKELAVGKSEAVLRSPNYTAFAALGGMVARNARNKNYQTNIIFDDCLLCNDAYKYIFDIFVQMKSNPVLEDLTGMFSWREYIRNFSIADSKESLFLQTADVIATSTLKSLMNVFLRQQLNDYEKFIVELLLEMCKTDNLLLVINHRYYDTFINSYCKA
ncbi:DUF3800 domain-containing protein [Prevotella melaninogenica]|jgi:hypothetical protein|uniref:DUF3800 domain-containing protein n=1 Tax=Prevotella melaninogenica TaxID=28132 RepID=UPI001BA7919C|nr:DUF3800 domain-containing protein [Prevotella melaninogenica]QUB69695.1 DUF3800 domain-containing protein [Prevotella melaninogenica]